MTLYRQLLILTWTMLLISLVAVSAVNFHTNSESLQVQLKANTDNALTSLGMRISPFLHPLDETSVEVTLNAAFDGAFYRSMRVELYAAGKIIQRENPANPEGVPEWFIELFPFTPVVAEAPVTTGWTESALIRIEGHPGYVQQQLWELANQLLLIYGSLFLVVALFCSWGLNRVMQPLLAIERQAKAVEDKDFSYRIPLPNTRELKRVVQAVNNLMDILQERFASHAKQQAVLQARLQQDGETGIATRQHLLNELEAEILDQDRQAALIMLRLLDAEKIRKQFGYGIWIGLVKATIQILRDGFQDEDTVIGRMSEAEIAVLVPVLPGSDLSNKLAELAETLRVMWDTDIAPLENIFLMTGTPLLADDSKASVLTRCDNQLSTLSVQGSNLANWITGNGNETVNRTRQAWVDLLRERIEQGQLSIESQGVFEEFSGPSVQQEVYVRLLDEQGKTMSAGMFMPVIEQFDLGVQLDLLVLDKALQQDSDVPFAINVSLSSMRDTRFVSRLSSLNNIELNCILIEISEMQLKRDRKSVESFLQILSSLSVRFGIDNVGGTDINLDYVSALKPNYLKVAPGLCRAGDNESLMLVTGICNTVHNLALPVYATVVEHETQLERLQQAGIDGFQGYINRGPDHQDG